MEQPPKGMPVEQLPLDLGDHEKQMIPEIPPTPEEVALETLPDAELNTLYKERVGVDPQVRGFDRAVVLAGLGNPDAEKDRLRAIDMAEDQELRSLGRQHF